MLERKGLPIRLVAAIIDGLLLAITATALTSVAGKIGYVLAALIYAGYPVIEILKAQSPAKMILKLKVTAASGAPATRDQLINRAKLRWAPYVAGAVLMLVALVVPILAMLGNLVVFGGCIALLVLSLKTLQTTNQALWDVKADTAVMGVASQPAAVEVTPAPAAPPTQA